MSLISRRLKRTAQGALAAAALSTLLLPVTAEASTSTPALPTAPMAGYAKAKDGAAVTSIKWLDSDMFDITINSPDVGGVEPVRVIVPKGWTATTHKTYPVLYAYHGGADTYVSWTRSTDIEKVAQGWNVMVVMPDGGQHGSYTNWFNNGKFGTPKWEDFHTQELLQLMQRNFHAGTSRAAMGISSGAQGAITYAARHPGLFKYAASFSGILHMTMPGIPALVMFSSIYGGDLNPWVIWGVPGTTAGNANWAAHDPYDLAQKLRGTGLFISAGTTGLPGPFDPTNLTPLQLARDESVAGSAEKIAGLTSQSLVNRLNKLGIPVTADLYGNGWHQWLYWVREYTKAWPLMMKAIGAERV